MRKAKRIIAMLLAMLLFIPQTVSAAGTENSHTITCMYVDVDGTVAEEPYFQIEVPAGMTPEEAMNEADYWLEWPKEFGYQGSFRTGTYDEETGKVEFSDEDKWLDTLAIVEADETYYVEWDKIDVGELNCDLKINNSEHVSLNGNNDVIQVSNQVLGDISNHLYSDEPDGIYSLASQEFVNAALTADKVEFIFDIKEHYDAETDTLNGMNFSFEMSLYEDGNAAPVKTEAIEKFDYCLSTVVTLDNPNMNGSYYMASLDENGELRQIEHEDGYQSWEETSWADEAGNLYYCVVEYMGEYEFSFQEDENGDDGPQVPENMIELEVSYYDIDGDWIFEPILIEITDETAGKTYDKLIHERLDKLVHYEGLKNPSWSIGGEIEDLNVPAEGGQFFSIHADYDNTIVQICIEYYDENGDYCYEYMKKLCDKSETLGEIKDSYNDYLAGIKHSEAAEFQDSWATYIQWSEGAADLTLTAGDMGRYDEFVISAEYGFYDVALTYAYLDNENEIKIVVEESVTVPAGKTVKDICDEKLGGSYDWAIHPWYPIEDGVIGMQTNEIVVAAQYDTMTPVFAERYFVTGEPGAYEPGEVSEIYYVNGHPEVTETEDGYVVDDTFTEAVFDAATDIREDVEGFEFAGYQLSYNPDYYEPEVAMSGYAPGVFYSLQELYDKGLVVLRWMDDTGEYEETVPVEISENADYGVAVGEYVLPQKGNMVQFWDIGGPTYGGDYEISGNTVQVFAPYIVAESRYRMGIDGLTEVPDGFSTLKEVKDALAEEAISGEDKLEADSVKCDYYDVQLMWCYGDGAVVLYEEFPQEGVEFYLPCPEGVDAKEENFRVTHLITDEEHPDKGETEKLEIIGIDVIDGVANLRVKAYSLSPVAVVYEGVETKPVTEFTDVPANAYYATAVDWAVENNITAGVGNGKFAPNDTCTRAQVVSFIHRGEGEPSALSSNNPFTDVKDKDYFYTPVLWAVENNITAGMTLTTFGPNVKCTRAQVVTFLWRAAGEPEPSTTTMPFTDVKAGQYYEKAVLWAVENNITSGTSETTFSPDASCTRGQVVCFMQRYYN